MAEELDQDGKGKGKAAGVGANGSDDDDDDRSIDLGSTDSDGTEEGDEEVQEILSGSVVGSLLQKLPLPVILMPITDSQSEEMSAEEKENLLRQSKLQKRHFFLHSHT